jgi:dTDP-glucose 4,6-dehydratase
VRSWFHTYKFPAIITNCSNNFGSRQHNEKLIPKVVDAALTGKPITIYGAGENVRDWLYVKDHCQGLILAALRGKIGESYCFGGNNELQNKDLILMICRALDVMKPNSNTKFEDNIIHVSDRKGHDFRYAIDAAKAHKELGWSVSGDFKDNLHKTIKHYHALNSVGIVSEA